MICNCPHTADYHRRPVYSQTWRCTACTVCGLGRTLHSPFHAAYTPKARGHDFTECQCTGANT